MQCPNCKKELAENAKTCPNCGYDFTEKMTQKATAIGCGFLLVIIIVLAILLTSCINSLYEPSDPLAKDNYKEEQLHNYAANYNDFLSTHEATGVIVGRAQYDGKYVIKVNRFLWDKLNTEQRVLIRYATEQFGKEKYLEGVVLDPKNNEWLN